MPCDNCRNLLAIRAAWIANVDHVYGAQLRALAGKCPDCARFARDVRIDVYCLSQDLFSGKTLPPGVTELNSDFITRAFNAIEYQQKHEGDEKDDLLRENYLLKQRVSALERQLHTGIRE